MQIHFSPRPSPNCVICDIWIALLPMNLFHHPISSRYVSDGLDEKPSPNSLFSVKRNKYNELMRRHMFFFFGYIPLLALQRCEDIQEFF